MTPTEDDVRLALERYEDYMNRESWYHEVAMGDDYKLFARFADAVLNPPMPVRVAMEYRAENPMRDNPGPNAVIADWIVSLREGADE